MKRNAWVIMLVVLLAGASLVYAEGMKGGMGKKGMMGKGMMDEEGMGMGKMGKGMMGGKMMKCPMMKSMMKRDIIATSDGGIIVVLGNKLTKYDKDLNVVKEVELKIDTEGMQKMMEEMKSMCPMMQEMRGDKMPGPEAQEESSPSEHEGHH